MGTLNKMSFMLAAGLVSGLSEYTEKEVRKLGFGRGEPRQFKNGGTRTGAAQFKRAAKKRRNIRARSSKRA
jgi:hypothetical protein